MLWKRPSGPPAVPGLNPLIDYLTSAGLSVRLKDSFPGLCIHAVARIINGECGIVSRRRLQESILLFDCNRLKAYGQGAGLIKHGMVGIGAKVHDDLVNLGWVDKDGATI